MHNHWLIGIDLGGTKTEVILLDAHSNEHFRKRVPTPVGDYPATLQSIQALVLDAEAHAGVSGIAVGIGIPGSVSRKTGCIKNGNSTWINGQPMQLHLQERLQRPVTLTNDANCLALSEATDGAGEHHHNVFAAILGTGCGAGSSIKGNLLTGPNGVAGEWGHNPLPWTADSEHQQRPCFCGRAGCNETFLSGTGLSLTHHLRTGQQQTAHTITENARQGDAQARQSLDHYLDHLARGLAGVINVLDPDIIVLGGGMSNVEQLYQELPDRLPAYVFGGECDTPVVRAVHGDSSGVRGAAWLAMA
ncbi:ROK family protein [Halopseudomonas salegens]|uniref:N-acetylglucosamine kinase n=1 Tax=Halopseudomonas salegens TaxID=1434072 RepID=A0A1H2ENY1_9GAMM|nr:ROK family protein [Halopseudomonas salegens]SDT96826.1 N-acetylglucosamine kinase [Halopseudomonas salegens]